MSNLLKNAVKLPIINWNFVMLGGHIQKVADDWLYPRERHLVYEMIYVIAGKERIQYDNQEIILNQGEFVIINPGLYHTVSSAGALTYFCFHFDVDEPQFEERLISSPQLVYRQNDKFNQLIVPYLKNMIGNISLSEQYTFAQKMQLQLDLTNFLLCVYKSTNMTQRSDSLYTMQYAKLLKANIKAEINSRIKQNINNIWEEAEPQTLNVVNIVCHKLNISPGYACKIYKHYFKIPPMNYCLQLKIQNAKRLLLKPQLNIAQVSYILGYQSAPNFSREFKKVTQTTPRKYRLSSVSKTFDDFLYKENFTDLYQAIKDDPDKNWQLY